MQREADGHHRERWGLILAGGEGSRLRPLTRLISGDERPKQFCAMLGRETLLEQTRRRAAIAIPPGRVLVALTRAHERYYAPIMAGAPPYCALVQPEDRGTAAPILYGALRIASVEPMGTLAVLPSDHWVSDDAAFMDHVVAAFTALRQRPDLVVLLGFAPESAETEYGWIEPADPIPGTGLFRVARFWEKPGPGLARALSRRDCLWNSFVMIARIPALLALFRSAVPELAHAFAAIEPTLGTIAERRVVRSLYRTLGPMSFSDDVLARRPANLAVLPVEGVRWSDWGRPQRVIETLGRLGIEPAWSGRAAALTA